jgi:type IV pilus assembly protein PilQ
MLPSTPFDQFLEFVNPVFERVTGKTVIDPEGRQEPIGVTITNLQFFDALEFVLELKGLSYRETDRYFIIQQAAQPPLVMNADQATGRPVDPATTAIVPATAGTREVQINAVLFDANLTKSLELGIDWSVWFGPQASRGGAGGGSFGGGTGGQGNNQNQDIPRIFVNTENLFDNVDEYIIGPDRISFSGLTQLIRVFEQEGLGETVASPTVTVQSGQQGNIQIGSDVPVQQRDFAGNTITQFFSTGIIIDVTPTVIRETVTDSLGTQTIEFIHLDVAVENSNSSPSEAGIVIARNRADTQVLLLDGEQTVIGGLYTTQKTITRRGVPILKDLPPWFFGLRYLFGYNRTDKTQRELLIIIQARLLDPLDIRTQRPFPDQLLERRRRQLEEDIRRMDAEKARDLKYPSND